ncbi:MAG: hypothetical protein HY014_11210 [Acidobacteria bacterium]|nr:hypothetical protein [Acidobacteriota bacterium]MBI3488722.1 hypothetical protein [Acidobacteriota bacterium]
MAILLLAVFLGCARPAYDWRSPAGALPPVILRVEVDPKVPDREAIQRIYPPIIQAYLADWLPMVSETPSTPAEAIYLNLYISCQCEGAFIRNANGTMKLLEIFDKDARRDKAPDPDHVQTQRLGYQVDDMQGSLSIHAPQTWKQPYKSLFLKTFVAHYMDPLSNDARLVRSNVQAEQARGLARWMVADLQQVGLASKAPVLKTSAP